MDEGPQTRVVEPAGSLGWRRLQIIAAVAVVISLLVPMLIEPEPFLLATAAPFIIGLLVMLRWTRVGIIWLGIVSLAVLLFSAPFLVDALSHPESLADFVPLCVFTVSSLVGVIAAVPSLRSGPKTPSRSARLTAIAAGAAIVVASLAAVVAFTGIDSAPVQPGDIRLIAEDSKFLPAEIEAAAGSISVHVTNGDSTRHTFTIDELGIDLSVPPNSEQRVTFDGEPGTYVFYCSLHTPGMEGELVVN